MDPARFAGQVEGAWLGRAIGNMMGKPVEKGWERHRLKAYLEDLGAYPLRDYVPLADEDAAAQLGFQSWKGLTRGRIAGGVRDDDLDYTVLGLLLLEKHGARLTTDDVAREWLRRFPVYQLYTAERAAYQNLVREVPLDEVGSHHNPYREWIGAQIRADVYGYCCPGRPDRAAALAHRDARLSHRSNGIYGAMWAAALVSAAFVTTGAEESVEVALEQVPAGSQLAAEVSLVLHQYRSGLDWEECMDSLDRRWAGLSWVHVLNNTGALTAALLWGRGDVATTVGLAVQTGLDTDSIAATAGSWAGAQVGRDGLPPNLVDPLEDRTATAVFGHPVVRFSELAERTVAVAQTMAADWKEESCPRDPETFSA
ncbi:MAG: ADP-ribosylglycohydrolase family protein [Actinobacteria bacterium]|nr:ADP-ribosylglycohydrolase family protein [Actinomycetota bacterium]